MNTGGILIAGPAAGALKGALMIPGDKSMSHRSVMLASLADGVTEIRGFLAGEDNVATAQMFMAMGVKIDWLKDDKTALRVHGVGLHGLKPAHSALNAGNAGTCVRLMTGILAGQAFESSVTGDASLCKRPMRRVVDPVRRMGATVTGAEGGDLLPLTIFGGKLKAIHHISEVASAQVKSCVLLAGLYAEGVTRVNEPKPTRDHTERMLPLFGQPVDVALDGTILLDPIGELTAPEHAIDIPADPSSACFFAVAAALVEGSDITLKSIGINARRDGWRRVMNDMGAQLSLENKTTVGEEPVADLRVQFGGLHGMRVNADDVPDAIDEFPVLFAAAALADGQFVLTDAAELRVKESDRIAAMAAALCSTGAQIDEQPDGAVIDGVGCLRGNVDVDAHGDHRIAMAMAVAAQRADGEVRIHNAAAIATSFPNFVPLAQSIGMNVRWAEEGA
ncbi:MAG: 3-phosphoshikimate 1-carboxyvinyltransferase [Mariprofundus sp.]|nr:3-phosphoshikimate 1-carboxyvinyltransferase [Mariprofundus sp.]